MPSTTRFHSKQLPAPEYSQTGSNKHTWRNKAKKSVTTAALKKRVRDLERLLQNVTDMPANVRVDKEKELQAKQSELNSERARNKRLDMVKRYRMVRFFETKKAERRLKNAINALDKSNSPSERESLERKLHSAEVDLNYTQYYPLSRPYCGLYPTKPHVDKQTEGDDNDAVDAGVRGDVAMWHKIEETMPKGQKALESLRDDVMERRKRPTDSETLTLQPKQKAKRAPIPSGVVSLVRTTQHHGNGKFLEGGTDVLDSGSDNEFFE